MKFTTVTCAECGAQVEKPTKEVTRSLKLGRKFFCNLSCGASYGNNKRFPPKQPKTCAHCGTVFTSSASTFCSVKCANEGRVVSDAGREKMREAGRKYAHKLSPASALRSREMWKYEDLLYHLQGVSHQFEFELDNWVFDLALLDDKILVEFDGKYHRGIKQQQRDREKEQVATSAGYLVIRIQTPDGKIEPQVLTPVLQRLNKPVGLAA